MGIKVWSILRGEGGLAPLVGARGACQAVEAISWNQGSCEHPASYSRYIALCTYGWAASR